MESKIPKELLTLEQRKMSQYDQYVAAFKAVDTDGSGTISKRELYAVLEKAGLTNGKQALEVFSGFDVDNDGQLDFDEFIKIAKIVPMSTSSLTCEHASCREEVGGTLDPFPVPLTPVLSPPGGTLR